MSVDQHHRVVTPETGQLAGPLIEHMGWRFLRSRRWIGYFSLFIVFSITCVLLGNWQFERRAEARAEIMRIDTNYDAAPLSLDETMPDPTMFDEDAHKWQPVEVTGVYESELYLARGRPGPEGVGANLIQPLRLEDGRLFFVDRGWVPVSNAEAGQSIDVIGKSLPKGPKGEVTVTARLRASEPAVAGRTTAGSSVGSIDLPELARLSDAAAGSYTGAYGQLISEQPSDAAGATDELANRTGLLPQKPERDEGPHLSYALQWYVFILIAGIGVAYAARQEYRSLNAGDASVQREDRRKAERRERRGPSDAEEEDALLDG